jgi:hypothetical protein
MGKLVLVLLLAAAGYYWYVDRQDLSEIVAIENPIYAEARVDLKVEGRELNMVLLGKMVDEEDCSARGERFWRDTLEACTECQFIRYECKSALDENYQALFANQLTRTSYVRLDRGNGYERDGRMLVWGLNKYEADMVCNLLKERMKTHYSGQVICVDGDPNA